MFTAGMGTGGATIGATARSLHKRSKSIESESGQNSNRIGEAGIRVRVPAPVVVRRGVGEAEVVWVHGAGHGLGRRGKELGGTSERVEVAAELEGKGEGRGWICWWRRGGDAVGCFLLGCLGGVRGRTGSVRVTRASDSLGLSVHDGSPVLHRFTQVGEGDGPAEKTGRARAIPLPPAWPMKGFPWARVFYW